jgi:hypothetical protein
MMTFRMPSGLTIEDFEAKLRSLQVWWGHRPIEIRPYNGDPALVNVLFVLRDRSVRAAMNSRVDNYLSQLTPSRYVILNSRRYPEYRINRSFYASEASVARALRTSLESDTRPWAYCRIYKSGAVVGETDPRSFGERVVVNDRSPEELLHWLHGEMLLRLDYLQRCGVECLNELPYYARLDPHLLVIDDIKTLLRPSVPEDLDVEDGLRRVAACQAFLHDIGRNPQVDIHVIVGTEVPFFGVGQNQNVSLFETLLVLGIDSPRYPTPDPDPGQALTGGGSHEYLRQFAALCGRLWIQLCLPIMVPRAMKEARSDGASAKRK